MLEDKNIPKAGDKDSMWRNLLAMYKRFESNEVPGVQVQLKFGDIPISLPRTKKGISNSVCRWCNLSPPGQAWHEVELELIEPFVKGEEEVKATGQVLIPPPNSQFGIISDIDDTILVSEVTHLLKMARLAFLNNARTRLPFAGVAAFYRALQNGPMEEFLTRSITYPVVHGTCMTCWLTSARYKAFRRDLSCCATWVSTRTKSLPPLMLGTRPSRLSILCG